MRLTRHLGIGIAAVLTGWAAPCPASAEIELTYFIGTWSGRGTDSDPPDPPWHSSLQQTKCTTTVPRADRSSMESTTVCDGEAGLHKEIHLSITLVHNQIEGDLSQTTNGGDPENGKVLGRRAGDTARFQVKISRFKSATVELTFLPPSSYSMDVTAITGTVMHVKFHKTAPR